MTLLPPARTQGGNLSPFVQVTTRSGVHQMRNAWRLVESHENGNLVELALRLRVVRGFR